MDVEHHFQQIANTLPLVVWTASPDGNLTYISNQWETFYGNPIAESLGTGWTKFVHPDDAETAGAIWAECLQSGKDYETEFRVQHKSGDYHWLLVRAVAIKNAAGEISAWYGSNTDIQDKKTIEKKIQEVITERTKELAEANANLQRSNAELAQFAYIASHDLQEPLRKISVFAQMLGKHLTGVIDAQTQNYLGKIDNSVARMINLVRDVLMYSEISGQTNIFQPVNLQEIIENITTDFELLIEETEAIVEFTGLPVIEAVPLQMSQLFGNLLSNSLKFIREDLKPVIRISATKMTDEEIKNYSLLSNGSLYYNIEIRDNGIGFGPEYAEQIFNIFQRLHGKSLYTGTGIGLAMCRKIVENHNGIIFAKSDESGAIFNVLLPAIQG